jgi:hypothetical protein
MRAAVARVVGDVFRADLTRGEQPRVTGAKRDGRSAGSSVSGPAPLDAVCT